MKLRTLISLILCGFPLQLKADDSDQAFRIIGLFDKERMEDLRQAMSDLHDAELLSCDYETGRAVVRLGEPWIKQREKDMEAFITRFGHDLRLVTRGNFDVRAPGSFPKKKWKVEKIPIYGLDCRGCSYGAYLAVCDLDGVERAVASFHEGFVTVWINPAKTDRTAIEKGLLDKKLNLEPIETPEPKK